MQSGADHGDGIARLHDWSGTDPSWYIAQLGDSEMQRFTTEHTDTTLADFQAALDVLNHRADRAGFAVVDAETGELARNLAAVLEDDIAGINYCIAPGFCGGDTVQVMRPSRRKKHTKYLRRLQRRHPNPGLR